jgi:diguanylate cyclase (GGDEF)-like protein
MGRYLRSLDAGSERWFPYVLSFILGFLVGHAQARVGLSRAIREALGQPPFGPRDNLPEVRELAADVAGLGVKAATDPLTELPNRLGISRILQANHGGTVGIGMVDIDHFKRINDQYGHTAGDSVLREVASRLRDSLTGDSAVGRWGGEEFLLIAPEVAGTALAEVGEAARVAVRSRPIVVGTDEIQVTCSVGVATPNLEHESYDDAIDRADRALLVAKQSRDAVVSADGRHLRE